MKIEINSNRKWQHSMTLKIILLAVMGLFLLIPLELIKSVIRERQQNSEKVREDIAFQWSARQNVSGPVLNIPVRIFTENKDETTFIRLIHIMPETLNISAVVGTEKRHRSIYQAVVYNSDLDISGEFIIPEINFHQKHEILWKEAYLTMGISDNRGLKGDVAMHAGTSVIAAVPGLKDQNVFTSGISFPFEIKESVKSIPFTLDFKLSGSEEISFSPVGKITCVHISSAWNSPGFTGSFLPASRTISGQGFSADWAVTNLNRNFPQSWTDSEFSPAGDSFGVEFILQADHYQKSLRSAKYGILFIALTFLALLFTEMSTRENFHILNYLLVSLALVLFFSLLNALSEHTGFNPAYIIASASTIIMISVFIEKLVKNFRPAALIAGLLILLYSFIFVLLTLNDYAYLAGNIGLFVLLAVTMGISLKFRKFRPQQEPEDH